MFQSKKSLLFLLVVALFLFLVVSRVQLALAAVTLVSFTATPGNGQVLVAWETANEVDNSGFYIYRSTNQTSGFEVVSLFIPANASNPTSSKYSFTDRGVTNSVGYYYELVAISTTNESQTFPPIGPIVPGVITATVTATGSTNAETSTPTRTPTQAGPPTATQIGAYPGPVQTPSLTPIPGQGTSAPTKAAITPVTNATLADFSTQLDGPTSTLRPFPSVTFEFPDATQTPAIVAQSTPGPGGGNGLSEWVNIARLGPLALIVLIWVLLGGWFYLTLRRME